MDLSIVTCAGTRKRILVRIHQIIILNAETPIGIPGEKWQQMQGRKSCRKIILFYKAFQSLKRSLSLSRNTVSITDKGGWIIIQIIGFRFINI